MLIRRLRMLAPIFLGLLALVAVGCGDDDDGTPTPDPATIPTVTETPTPTATASPTATTSFLDQVADDEALFCAADPAPAEGSGFYRRETCGSGDGFITKLDFIEGEVAVDEFVPACLQPQGEEGVVLVVGRRCVDLNPVSSSLYPAITSQPFFEEFWAQFEDGALVPWCRNAEADESGDPQEACIFASDEGLVPILPAAD